MEDRLAKRVGARLVYHSCRGGLEVEIGGADCSEMGVGGGTHPHVILLKFLFSRW